MVIGLALLALLSSVATTSFASTDGIEDLDRVRIVSPPRAIKEAELIDQSGEPFTLSELNGRIALIFFGFTNCPDVCPLAMQRLLLLADSGEFENSEVAYVMIGIDPARDTPEAMQKFLLEFSDEFIGLSGDRRQLKTVSKNFSASFFKANSNSDGNYNISHSPQIFVLDRQGKLRAEFYDAPVDSMITVVRALLDEA
jgi:protein SCO1/2